MEGEPEAVMDYYNAKMADHQNQSISQTVKANGAVQTISGTGQASIESVLLTDENDQSLEVIELGQRLRLKVTAKAAQDLPEVVLGFMIKDRLGQPIFGTNSHHCRQPLRQIGGGQQVHFVFEFNANLGPGHYSMALALHTRDTHIENNYEWRDQALNFQIVNNRQNEFVGFAWLNPTLRIDT
jgi:lipopolysaccharide transport system ATP-binding protein